MTQHTYRIRRKTPAPRVDRFVWDEEAAAEIFAAPAQKFDPNQPRYPKGHPLGGKWADDAWGGAGSADGPDLNRIARNARNKVHRNRPRLKKDDTRLADFNELVRRSAAYQHWRDWYKDSEDTLVELFGPENAETLALFLAAGSIQTSVERNTYESLHAYAHYLGGGRFDDGSFTLPGVMGSRKQQYQQVVDDRLVSGPKLTQFAAALTGDLSAVTMDRHMRRLTFGTDKGSGTTAQHLVGQAVWRAVSSELGWSARDMQAVVWSMWVTEQGFEGYDTNYTEQLAYHRDLVDSIRSMPSFVRREGGAPGFVPFTLEELADGFHNALIIMAAIELYTELAQKFDPNQPRDAIGRWTPTGGYVPRAAMPQIQTKNLPDFYRYARESGVSVDKRVVNATRLKYRQAVDPAHASAMPEFVLDKPILVSKDYHVLDGNHRAAAAAALGRKVNVVRLGLPFQEAIDFMFTYPGVMNLEEATDARQRGYDPNQPRHPAGTSEGGRFAPAGGGSGGVSVTTSEMLEGLSADKSTQPVNTWDELHGMAKVGQQQLRAALGRVAEKMGLRTDLKKPDNMTPEDIASEDGFVFMGPLKSFERASAKAEGDYKGNYNQVLDVVRATVAVRSPDDVRNAIAAMYDTGVRFAHLPKDRFDKPTDMGYRDLLGIVKLPNGMLAEVQFHVKAMTAAKSLGHDGYVVTEALRRKYGGSSGPTATWSSADTRAYRRAQRRQLETYSRAWEIANGEGAE